MKSNEPDFLYYNRGLFKVRRPLLRLFGLVLSVAFLFILVVVIVLIFSEPLTAGEYFGFAFVCAMFLTGAVFCLKKSKKPKG